jgi:hypothetical protein
MLVATDVLAIVAQATEAVTQPIPLCLMPDVTGALAIVA